MLHSVVLYNIFLHVAVVYSHDVKCSSVAHQL